jgi:hypothetical protein
MPGVTLAQMVRARGGYYDGLAKQFGSQEVQLDKALELGVLPGIAAGGASVLAKGLPAAEAERVQPGRSAVAQNTSKRGGTVAMQQQGGAAKRVCR